MSFQKLCQSVLTILQRQVRPRYQRTCLETLRILSRDKRVLAPVATKDGMLLLGQLARLHGGHNGDDNQNSTQEDDRSEDEEKVVVEALKCLCNVVYNSPEAQQVSVDVQLAHGLCASLSTVRTWHHEVGLFTLRLVFLLSALRSDVRGVMKREWHAVRLLSEVLEHTLDVRWVGPHEAASPDPQALPMPADDNERAMETLKALFNLTLSSTGGDVSVSYNSRMMQTWCPSVLCRRCQPSVHDSDFDTCSHLTCFLIGCDLSNPIKISGFVLLSQEDDRQFRVIAAVLRHLLMLKTETEEKTEEAHR